MSFLTTCAIRTSAKNNSARIWQILTRQTHSDSSSFSFWKRGDSESKESSTSASSKHERSTDQFNNDDTIKITAHEHVSGDAPRVSMLENRVLAKPDAPNALFEELRPIAWLETLSQIKCEKRGLVNLHPSVFAAFPRFDLVEQNLEWQGHYQLVDYRSITTRGDIWWRSNKKPWPQKGTGRARHGDRKSQVWQGGGQCKGPRGPTSYFGVIARDIRLAGLISMLSTKLAQGDLHIVEDFRLPMDASLPTSAASSPPPTPPSSSSSDSSSLVDPVGISAATAVSLETSVGEAKHHLHRLVEARGWGPAVLFITEFCGDQSRASGSFNKFTSDSVGDGAAGDQSNPDFPLHLAHVCEKVPYFTLMPYYGLNCWSMVKYETLVVSVRALELIESSLVRELNRTDITQPRTNSKLRTYDSNYEPWDEETRPEFRGSILPPDYEQLIYSK